MITAIELGNSTCGGDVGICFHVGITVERNKLEMCVERMSVVAYERKFHLVNVANKRII